MKNIIVVTLALVAIIGVSYWTFDTLRQRAFTGENLTFEVGGGYDISVTNRSDRPVPIEMRAAGRTPFRIRIPTLGLQESSTLQGAGPDIYHTVAFALPPGQVTIHVTRGSTVRFVSNSDTALHAVVTPLRAEDIQLIIMLAGTVILIALYCISSTIQHRWVGILRDKSTGHSLPTAAIAHTPPSATSYPPSDSGPEDTHLPPVAPQDHPAC